MRPDSRAAFLATRTATRLAAGVSARLAEPFADRLWFTPWRVPPSETAAARERAWLAATAPMSGLPHGLAGFVAGPADGPTVLLVHGWGDQASRLGAFVAPLTEEGFRVVGIDLPAHGASPGGRTDLYTLGRVVRQVAQRVGAVAVVAHSLGGPMTVLALRGGLDLGAVVLLAPAVDLDSAVDRFVERLRLPDRAGTGLRRRLERRFGAGVWVDLRADLAAPALDVPALVVHDHDDTQVAVERAAALAAAWPGAQLLLTRGLGHNRVLRDAEVVQRATGFLRAAVGAEGRQPVQVG